MALHLYGIVRAGMLLPPGGAQGVELSTVQHEDLAVVVSEVGEETTPTDAEAVGHFDVLASLVQLGPVLPLRFGTLAPDEQSVREEVLGSAPDALREQLDAVDGLVELRLDLTFDEQAALRAVVAEDPSLRAHAAGRDVEPAVNIELGEKVVQRIVDWRHARAEELLRPVCKVAQSWLRLPEPAPTVDRVALLCRMQDLDSVDAAVTELGKQAAEVSVEYVGPLPVFSFPDQLTASSAEQQSRWGW